LTASLRQAKTMPRSSDHSATVLHDIHQRQRADGPAAMLGTGTANPAGELRATKTIHRLVLSRHQERSPRRAQRHKTICENLLLFN